ncbi:MAG: hypothetical protein RR555_01560 [Bacteroidales bacterium]
MKSLKIFLLAIVCCATIILSRATGVLSVSFTDTVASIEGAVTGGDHGGDGIPCSGISGDCTGCSEESSEDYSWLVSVPDTSKLLDALQFASYNIPEQCNLLSSEKPVSSGQRRHIAGERNLRYLGKQLMDFTCLNSKLKGFNSKNYTLKLASDGVCLNASTASDFFIYSLRKIRV